MIADILDFLKNRLNAHFESLSVETSQPGEDKVVFLEGDQKPDAVNFKLNAVTVLLVNIERDLLIRQPDNYVRVADNGQSYRVNPDIIVNLYVMFVAKYNDYKHGLSRLSLILRFFQANPYFDAVNAPDIGSEINHLTMELNTLTTTQQSELWGILRCSYLPSLVYKVKAAAFVEEAALPSSTVSEIVLTQKHL